MKTCISLALVVTAVSLWYLPAASLLLAQPVEGQQEQQELQGQQEQQEQPAQEPTPSDPAVSLHQDSPESDPSSPGVNGVTQPVAPAADRGVAGPSVGQFPSAEHLRAIEDEPFPWFFSGQRGEDQPAAAPEPTRSARPHFLSSFKLPDKLEFAGEPVPSGQWQVRERIEREFYTFLAEEGESIIMAKRTGRCFPPVEKELAKAGLPDDLKYMLLVESKCRDRAYSRAGASGPWQFIRSTAKRFKLKRNRWRDERRNLERSTEAAIKYLALLKEKMGDWDLAMAAYNTGENRIRKKLRKQKVDDYWKLYHVSETMRYVPRVIAAKEIFSQPEKYLGMSKDDLYKPLDTETVSVRVRKRREHLSSIAARYGTYFLELKMLNPELRREHLPRGTYKLKVPKQGCPAPCPNGDDSP